MDALEQTVNIIREDVRYLRDKIDRLEIELRGIIWKVVAIGSGSGALGFVVALLVQHWVSRV